MAHVFDNLHHHEKSDDNSVFGFWIYILSDCILFAILFASYAVLSSNVYGGVGIKEITSMPQVFIETLVLLTSSFSYGLAILASYKNHIRKMINWLLLTWVLGLLFLGIEVNEFVHLYIEHHSWSESAALSAFFTLVGTHGLHVLFGLIWMMIIILQVKVFGSTRIIHRRLTYLGLFWSFLDIVWIFVFTIVYLMGALTHG